MGGSSTQASGTRTALVTGASSGIGRELAKLLARDGHRLVLTGRARPALEEVARLCTEQGAPGAEIVVADLGRPEGAMAILDFLAGRSLGVDILINNAGLGVYGRFDEVDPARHEEVIQVNVAAVTRLTAHLAPGMVERGWGRILNVASTAAFVPGPLMSVYYASKAYVLSWSVALARELRRRGVTVTVLCPGPTATAFQERAGMAKAKLFRIGVMSAEAVARAGYEGMKRGKAVVVPGILNKATALASRGVPRGLLGKIAMELNRQR